MTDIPDKRMEPDVPEKKNSELLHDALLEYLAPKVEHKIAIRFKAIGRARILKQQVYRVASSERFQTIEQFLRRQLGLKSDDMLYIYVNTHFIPAPEEILMNLYTCFKVDDQLILSYSPIPAFG